MSNHAFFVYLARVNIVNSVAKISILRVTTKHFAIYFRIMRVFLIIKWIKKI